MAQRQPRKHWRAQIGESIRQHVDDRPVLVDVVLESGQPSKRHSDDAVEGSFCGDVLYAVCAVAPRMGSRRDRAARLLADGPVNAPELSQPRQA